MGVYGQMVLWLQQPPGRQHTKDLRSIGVGDHNYTTSGVESACSWRGFGNAEKLSRK